MLCPCYGCSESGRSADEKPSAYRKIYIIGSDQPLTILELARRVCAIVNPKAEIVHQSFAEAYDHDFEDVRDVSPISRDSAKKSALPRPNDRRHYLRYLELSTIPNPYP